MYFKQTFLSLCFLQVFVVKGNDGVRVDYDVSKYFYDSKYKCWDPKGIFEGSNVLWHIRRCKIYYTNLGLGSPSCIFCPMPCSLCAIPVTFYPFDVVWKEQFNDVVVENYTCYFHSLHAIEGKKIRVTYPPHKKDKKDEITNAKDVKCVIKDQCKSSPCKNQGTCVKLYYSYTCNCPKEFYGKHCEKNAGKSAGKLTHGVQLWFPLQVVAGRLFPFLVTVSHEVDDQIIEVTTHTNYLSRFKTSNKVKGFDPKKSRCNPEGCKTVYKGTLVADGYYLKRYWKNLPILSMSTFAIGFVTNITIKVFNERFSAVDPVFENTIDSFTRLRQQDKFFNQIGPSCDCQVYADDKQIQSGFCTPLFARRPKLDPSKPAKFFFKPVFVEYNWRLYKQVVEDPEVGKIYNSRKNIQACREMTIIYHWRFYNMDGLYKMTEMQETNKAFEEKDVCAATKEGTVSEKCDASFKKLKSGDYMVRLTLEASKRRKSGYKRYMDKSLTNYYCYFHMVGEKKRELRITDKSPIKECNVTIDTQGYEEVPGSDSRLIWTCTSVKGGKCPPQVVTNHKKYLERTLFADGTYTICVDWRIDDKSVSKPCVEVIAVNCNKKPPPGPVPPPKQDIAIRCVDNCGNSPDPKEPQIITPVYRDSGDPVKGKIIWELTTPNGTKIPIDQVTIPGGGGRPQAIHSDNKTTPPYTIEYHNTDIPIDGNCTMSPLQGMKGFTLFDIECYGWQAEGPILYEFFDKGPDDIEHYQGRMIGYSYSGILSKFRLTRGKVVIYLLNADGDGPSVNMTVELTDFNSNMTHIQYLINEIDDYMDYNNYQPSLDMMSTIAEILYENMNNEHYIRKIISTMHKVEIDSAESMKLGLSTILSVLTNGTQKGTYLLDDVLEKYTGKILLTLAQVYLKYATLPDHTPRMRAKHIHQLSRNMMDCVDMTMIAQDTNVTKLGPEEDINYDVLDNLNEASNDISEALMIAMYVVGRVQPYAAKGREISSTEKVTDMWAYVNNADSLVDVAGSNISTYVNITKDLAETFNQNHDIMLQFALMKKNLFWWAQNNINTELIVVGLAERLYRPGYYFVPRFSYPVNIYMKVKKVEKTVVNGVATQLDPDLDSDTLDRILLVHRFILPPLSKLYITFNFNNSGNGTASPLRVLARYNERPNWESMSEEAKEISSENPVIDIPYDIVEREHFYYLGILPDITVAINDTVEYTFVVHFVNCHIWENQWVNHYCLVGPRTSEETVECQCTHMSVFSSSIFIPPNDINPILDAPLFLTVLENPWVVVFVIVILLLFLLLLLWAFRKDKKDALCSDVIVLHDNFPGESYAYLVAIFTGSRLTAGTTAVVGFRLYGDTYASRPTILKCETRKVLQRDTDDWFLLCYPVSLGILNAVQMWHDNSGRGPDWYCSKVIVYDIEAKTQYIFVVDQWLAMEVDEFPEAMVRPATADEVMGIKRIFLDNSVFGLRENHLHLSIFARHPRSPVSRKQRLVVLMVLIMTAMLASIMFFKVTDRLDENVDEYHYSFGKRELIISVQSFIISTVFAIIAMFLFRKSYKQIDIHKHRSTLFMPRKRSSITNLLSEKPAFVDLSTFIAYNEKLPKQRKDMSMYEAFIAVIRRCTHQKTLRPVHLATEGSEIIVKKGWLIAAWAFSVLVILISAYFVMLYSLKFGKIKSLQWLSSLVISQAQDIFLFTPLKILFLALLLSAAFERSTDISSFTLDVNKAVKGDLIGNKKYLNQLVEARKKSTYYPMTDEVKARKRRKAMRKMKWRIIFDFLAVLSYILLLCYITKVLWSGAHYYPNTHASDIMMEKYHGRFVALKSVFNRTQFFSYMQNTFVRSLFVFRWFSDLKFETLSPPDEPERKDWAKDFVSKMVGAPRLRQLRVIPGSCTVHQMMLVAIKECTRPFSKWYMDTDTYAVEWKKAQIDDIMAYAWGHKTYWMYMEPKNTSVFPISGKSGTVYPSGGYLLTMAVKRAPTKSYAITIEQEHWIDERTRAVFLELTLYNVNNNLFSQMTAIIEQMTSGLYMTSANVDSVHTQEDWSVWNVIYIIFIVALFLRIAYKMNRNGLFNFCTRFINVYEVLVIVISVLSVVYYLVHLKVSSFYVEEFHREGLDRFFNFKDMIKYFLFTKVFLWVLFCLLVFRLFVSWYFGRTYFHFYHTFLLSKRWVIILMLTVLFYFFIIWRYVGYTIDAMLFYNYRVNILYHKMYDSIYEREYQDRTKIVALIICLLVLLFKFIFFVMFAHYYKIGKRKALTPMQNFNFLTFFVGEINRCFRKKKEEELTTDRQIHRKRDMKVSSKREN